MHRRTYTAPEAELLEVRFEESYLASSGTISKEESTELFVDDGEVDI